MKFRKMIVLTIMVFIPQNIFAFDLYGFYELRGTFLEHHKIKLADPFSGLEPGPTLNFKDNYAYKFGLGYRFNGNFYIGMAYDAMLDKDQKHEGMLKNAYPLVGKSDGFSSHGYDKIDGWQEAKELVTGQYGFEVIDLEFGVIRRFKPGIYLKIIVGGRYGKYNQEMSVIRKNECVPNHPSSVRSCDNKDDPFGFIRNLKQKIDGFGPRFGLSVIAPIKNTNFNLIGSTSYSILYAKKDIHDNFSLIFNFDNDRDGETRAQNHNSISTDQKETIIRYLDIEGGLQFELKFVFFNEKKVKKKSSILLDVGYKYSAHFGALNTFGISINKKESDAFGDKEDDFISHGPFVRLGFKF